VDIVLGVPISGPYVRTSRFGDPRDYDKDGVDEALHEGVDLAPIAPGARILAAADGAVVKVGERPPGKGLGKFAIMSHNNGRYSTWYGHAEEIFVQADPNRLIPRGTVLGLVGKTGNTGNGIHLHFNLQVHGLHRGVQDTRFVLDDVVNPEAYISLAAPPVPAGRRRRSPGDRSPAPPPPPPPPGAGRYIGPAVTFVAGIHGPGDAFTWHNPDFRSVIETLGLPVKQMSDGDRADFYNQFFKPSLDLVRVFWKPDPSRKKSAQQAWDEDIADGVRRFYQRGARDFEMLNEPTLGHEGMGHQWQNGEEFGLFLRELMLIVKRECPEARLWYPGESPGVPWTNQFAFSGPAFRQVADLCFGVCQHAYTGVTDDATKATQEIVEQVKNFHRGLNAWSKPIIVSESSVNRAATPEYRAQVYTNVRRELARIPGVKGIYWYVSHWNAPRAELANAESWFGTNLPELYKRHNP
jgi:hypothetical protein